jgi:hypothetical protein
VERAYRQSTRVLSVLLLAVGVALVATTLASGGGPLAAGVVLGVLLAGLGAGRLLLAGASSGDRERA